MILKYSKCSFFALYLIKILIFSENSYGARYIDLPIYSFGVKNSKLTLIIEQEILVPSLAHIEVNDRSIFSILPFRGSAESVNIAKILKTQSGITMGHTMPYIYIAINHAFDRIYYNSIIRPRPNQDSIRKSMGFVKDLNHDGLNNIRDILSIRDIENQKLIVEVYSNITSLKNAQGNLKFISEEAFWDPSNHRIGFFFDPKLFYFLPSQVSWGNQTNEEAITFVRDYVSKRFIQTISHELVHFIQFAIESNTYNVPFLAEASAIFLEENIVFREDLFQVSATLNDHNVSSEDSLCNDLRNSSPPLYALAMIKVKNGIKASLQPKFNLESILLMNEKEFYTRSSENLQELYDISLAFSIFIMTIPRQTFHSYFKELFKDNDIKLTSKYILGLNKRFIAWAKDFDNDWWPSTDSTNSFETTEFASTLCLGNKNYMPAYLGANRLIAMRPNSPIGWLYIGDVFWNIGVPFFAFDYYARGVAVGKKYGFVDNSEIRIMSRLADGYEILGNIESAVKMYHDLRIKSEKKINVEDLVPFLRFHLKELFYTELIARDEKQSKIALSLINTYVDVFQLIGCPTENEYLNQVEIINALKKYDMDSFEKNYREIFEEIKNRLVKEMIKTRSLEEILLENQKRCD